MSKHEMTPIERFERAIDAAKAGRDSKISLGVDDAERILMVLKTASDARPKSAPVLCGGEG